MILIDMPKPETCKECFARDGVFCKASKYKRISYPELETKAEWCPLHEVTADPDTVSRQAARDAVCEELDSIDHVPQWVFDRLTKKIENLPPSPTLSRQAEPHTSSLETPCDDCDFADKCTYESNCPHEAIWKAEHEGGAV